MVVAADQNAFIFSEHPTTDGFAQEAQRRLTIPLGCQQEVHRSVAPALSTARYEYFHTPLTLT
jgi:hypothetical protein